MNVELLADKRVNFSIRVSIPWHITDILSTQHVARADTVPLRRSSGFGTLALVLGGLLVLLEGSRRVKCAARGRRRRRITSSASSLLIILSASILVVDAALPLYGREKSSVVDAIVISQIVETDVLHRVEPFLGDQLHDTLPASVDRVILELHNSASTQSFVITQVTSKARHRGNNNDDLVLLTSSGSTQNALDNGSTDLVLDRSLRISRGRDEELVLDVHEVLTVLDNGSICIRNRVLDWTAVTPFSTAADNLAGHVPTTLRLGTTVGGEPVLVLVNLAGKLTTKLTTVLRELLTEALRCETPIPVASMMVVINTASAGMRSFLTGWRGVVRSLTLVLALIG